MDRIGNRLRELREARELKRQDLAVEFSVDPTTVYRWETGASEIDDVTKLALARFFGVSPEHLMGWDRTDVKADSEVVV